MESFQIFAVRGFGKLLNLVILNSHTHLTMRLMKQLGMQKASGTDIIVLFVATKLRAWASVHTVNISNRSLEIRRENAGAFPASQLQRGPHADERSR